MKFLIGQELPLRGSYDKEEHHETGLFQALLKYTIRKDTALQDCIIGLPKNAIYTSPEIQNEMIHIMAQCVKNQVVQEINEADVPFYCLMADGTRDRNNREAISVAIRYIRKGIPTESLLSIEEAKD